MKKTGFHSIFISHNLGGGNSLVSITPIFDWRAFFCKCRYAGRFLTGLFFCALLLSTPAGAQQDENSPPDTKSGNQTQILTDQDKGTVTIVIDGQPAVMIDKTGLYVVNEIMYGRSLTDTGPDWVKARIEKGDLAKDSEGGADDAP